MSDEQQQEETTRTPSSEQPLVAGTLVLCDYRNLWVGAIEEPGDDPAAWNGRNSERECCSQTHRLPVRYEWGRDHDGIANLYPVTPEQAALPVKERIALLCRLRAERHAPRANQTVEMGDVGLWTTQDRVVSGVTVTDIVFRAGETYGTATIHEVAYAVQLTSGSRWSVIG